MPSAVDFELGQRWVPLKAAESGTGLVGVSAAFRQPGTQRAGVHKDLRPGSAAWWRGQGGGHAVGKAHFLLLIWAWGPSLNVTISLKAKHCVGFVLMILRVGLDALLVMVGTKYEKKRNKKCRKK